MVRVGLAMVAMAWAAVGGAAEPLVDVVRPLPDGAWINWTDGVVTVSARAEDPSLSVDSKPLEQRAITAIDARVGSDCAAVPLTHEVTLGEAVPSVTRDAVRTWSIAEGRYHRGGAVELLGEASILELASTWHTARSRPGPALDVDGPTGVVIDARGTSVSPVFAPSILSASGEVLWDGTLWRDASYDTSPVVWVADPAHPAAVRAGRSPVFLVADAGRTGRIVLSAEGAARFTDEVSPWRMLGEGKVVVVVDP